MATYEKRGNKWRVKVRRKGISKSESFRTKAEGRNWAAQIESEIDTGKHTKESKHTLAEALVRFRDEVSPTREGSRWESVRLNKLISELPKINILLSDVDPEYIAAWRDERLKKVLPSSVNRELNVLSAVFTQAVREWRWCQENPVRLVKRPKNPKARDRLISPEERKSLLEALGYIDGEEPSRSGHYVAYAFLVALETAMRAGEILSLSREKVFEKRVRVKGKNGDLRDVPLSAEARSLLSVLLAMEPDKAAPLFKVSSASVSVLFRKACRKKGIEDLTFHDTRHDAITRLAKKLEVLDLARMVGHRDLRSLMIYYNETADSIADRLD
jgi:integrase